ERLGHRAIVIGDEGAYLGAQIVARGERAALEQLAHEDAQPDLDLVEPGAVLGRVVEHDAVAGVAQERRPRVAMGQDAALALRAQVEAPRPDAAATQRTRDAERWVSRLSTTK